jgi:hypothetical protein
MAETRQEKATTARQGSRPSGAVIARQRDGIDADLTSAKINLSCSTQCSSLCPAASGAILSQSALSSTRNAVASQTCFETSVSRDRNALANLA